MDHPFIASDPGPRLQTRSEMTMIPQHDLRLLSLFELAVDLDPDRRARFVEHACADDPALRDRLEAMLSADRRSTGSILAARPPSHSLRAARPPSHSLLAARPPSHIPELMVDTGEHDLENDTIHAPLPTDWLRDPAAAEQTAELAPGQISFLSPAAPQVSRTPAPRTARPPALHTVRPAEPRPAPPAELSLGSGTRIQHYELIREIGRGGMGAVFMARDTKLGRRVAIKFLHTDDRRLTERFVLEARATARCSHENIVVIHDVNHYQAIPYMVLEYLKGQPLNHLVGDERIPPGRAVQLMVPVVRALVCAHQHNIVHRDLKPANIFMTDSGTIKVLDFGIAKFVYDTAVREPGHIATMDGPLRVDNELTSRDAVVGTLPYMSPEQWGADAVDHRTDIWAVGIILYRMLTGNHPLGELRGEQFMVTGKLDQPMPSAHAAGVDMPLGLADVIDSCLKKRKNERMPSAAKLLRALEPYLPGRRPAELDSDECPYTGLGAFQESDSSRFFGRTREIGTILARLHSAPLIGLVGPSGTGKSSLVRAGVIPALQASGDTWEAMVIRPGRHPMAALANLVVPMVTGDSSISEQVAEHQEALQRLYREPGYFGTVLRSRARTRGGKLLLFVDQFEELFTLSPSADERLAFTACLVGMADDAFSPLRLMLSIRSDFLDRVAEDRHFMSELSQGLYFVGPPDREGLRDAIVRPAEMVRYRFDNVAMVEHMLDTLQTTAGCLPLLQFAAAKLWDARDRERHVLTQASYDALGGVAGALATHADAVLAAMTPRDQALVRTIFLQLVTPERTRAIKSIDELREIGEPSRDIDILVQHLVDARLLVVQRSKQSGGIVEIVHESLLHTWPTLAHWLEENQEDAIFLEQLRTAARQWDGRGRSRDLLWRGDTLDEARSWRRRYSGTLPAVQAAFLDAAFAHARRGARMRRLAVAGSMTFLTLVAVAATVALVVIRNAEVELRNKEKARLAAMEKVGELQAVEEMSKEQLAAANEGLKLANVEMQQALTAAEQAKVRKDEALQEVSQANHALQQAVRRAEEATQQANESRDGLQTALKGAERARKQAEESEKTARDALSRARKAEKDLQEQVAKETARANLLDKQLTKLKADRARGGL
jgi:eukaryotic-like serine/threonine-protein kinase